MKFNYLITICNTTYFNPSNVINLLCFIQRFENICVPLNVPAHVLQVATFIVERILSTDAGLNYCCNFGDRFYVTTSVLRRMTDKLVEEPSRRLLKLIIKCFIELSKGPRYSITNKLDYSRLLTSTLVNLFTKPTPKTST